MPWIAAASIAGLFAMVAAFGTVQPSPEPPLALEVAVEALAIAPPAVEDSAPSEFWTEDRFHSGDTLAALLDRLGVGDEDIVLLRRFQGMAFRSLRPGAIVQARITGEGELRWLSFLSGRDRLTTIERDADGFRLSEQAAPLTQGITVKSAQIRSSLFAATDAADIPDGIASQLADIFAADIDFHRDLRLGDRLSVIYETYSYAGRDVRSGRVLAAEILNQGRSYQAFWYTDGYDSANSGGYYSAEGKSLRRSFLRSPLEFSRVSSGFGLRMHPIEQRWRAHNGVDYAAPQGTRVKATADGVVAFLGWQSGYGNVIELKHHSGFSTWYAHLSAFAKGLRPGAKVAQGDLIGFVGQTGWATGPHLHYEFRVNNQYRNPLTIAFPGAQPLPSGRLPVFQEHAAPLAAQLNMLRDANIALLE